MPEGVTVTAPVCTAFHGECPPGLECTHRNDVHDDNRPSNLKWDTHKQNCVEAYMNGRLPITKLTDDDIIEMRELYTSNRFKQVDLALIYGVSQRTVSEHLST